MSKIHARHWLWAAQHHVLRTTQRSLIRAIERSLPDCASLLTTLFAQGVLRLRHAKKAGIQTNALDICLQRAYDSNNPSCPSLTEQLKTLLALCQHKDSMTNNTSIPFYMYAANRDLYTATQQYKTAATVALKYRLMQKLAEHLTGLGAEFADTEARESTWSFAKYVFETQAEHLPDSFCSQEAMDDYLSTMAANYNRLHPECYSLFLFCLEPFNPVDSDADTLTMAVTPPPTPDHQLTEENAPSARALY
jgi:hypothetical protein